MHDLDRLFRKAGHHMPATDLTARIMARVAVTPMARPVPVRPLIGRWGWMAMAAALLGLLVFVLGMGTSPTGSPPVLYLTPWLERLGDLRPPQGEWPLWITGASVLAFLFVVIDQAMDGAGMRRSGS